MSLEQSIASLTATATQLLSIPESLRSEFTAGRQALEALVNSRITTRTFVIWVNSNGGSDANTGASSAQPVATIARAVALIPAGAHAEIRLMSDHILTQQVQIYARSVTIRSDSSVRRRLTWGREIQGAVGAQGRQSIGFRLGGHAMLAITGLTLVVPPLDGNFTAITPNSYAPLITSADVSVAGPQCVTISYCDIEQPATPFAAILGSLAIMEFFWFVNTLVGGVVTSMNGRVLEGVTASGGTPPPSFLTTNLAQI